MMKLLSSLKKTQADNLVILTYNLDLSFFEYMLFEPLYGAGCRNVLILCDPNQYRYSLRDIPLLRYAGQRYTIIPSLTSPNGAFHVKMVLLTSKESGKLFLGSGNLTKSGYIRNWEVFTEFSYTAGKKENEGDARPFIWAYQQISKILSASDKSHLGIPRLEQLVSTTPWLNQPANSSDQANYWLLSSLEEPLLNQFMRHYQERDGSKVDAVTMVSPFFDPYGRAVQSICDALHPHSLHIYSQNFEAAFPPETLQKIGATTHVSAFRACCNGRNLHAKGLMVKTQQGVWLATGSANISTSAWLKTAGNANTEMVVLRFEPDSANFDDWFAELAQDAEPISLDWQVSDSSPVKAELVLSILETARLDGTHLILTLLVTLPPEWLNLKVEFENQRVDAVPISGPISKDATTIQMDLPKDLAETLNQPTVVRLVFDAGDIPQVSNEVLLHNSVEISKFSHPVTGQRKPPKANPQAVDSEDIDAAIALMEELQELLATDKEKYRKATRRIRPEVTGTETNEPDLDELYDPDRYLVDETERPIEKEKPASSTGIYGYWDQFTYDAILRAALGAVIQHFPGDAVNVEGGEKGKTGPDDENGKVDTGQPGSGKKPASSAKKKLEKLFSLLINTFIKGLDDPEYLELAPFQYLAELQTIILTCLRLAWKRDNISSEAFIELSVDLLWAFWGTSYESGAWQSICENVTDEEFQQVSHQLNLRFHLWLHAYILSQLLKDRHDDICGVASLMRSLQAVFGRPVDCLVLSDDEFVQIWIQNVEERIELVTHEEMLQSLENTIEIYNEDVLIAEIGYSLGSKPWFNQIDTADLTNVPCLNASVPLTVTKYDDYLKAFLLFTRNPKLKHAAYALFTNANPAIGDDDTRIMRMLYASDVKRTRDC